MATRSRFDAISWARLMSRFLSHDMNLLTVMKGAGRGKTDKDAPKARVSKAASKGKASPKGRGGKAARARPAKARNSVNYGTTGGSPRSLERNYRQAEIELEALRDTLQVEDDVMEKAHEIYRMSIEKSLVRGRSIAALTASAFYAACRACGAQVTLKDIQQACNTTRKDISRCYRLMLRELDITMPVVDATECIERISDNAGLTKAVRKEAAMLLKKSKAGGISAGKDPMGLAAAALYLACTRLREHETQKNIARAAYVTEVTIRNRYKGLKHEIDRLEAAASSKGNRGNGNGP